MVCSCSQFQRLATLAFRRLGAVAALADVAFVILSGPPSWAAAPDEVTQRGFRHTTRDRDLVAKAAARANEILTGTGIRFVPIWQMEASEANKADGAGVVPLYLVESPGEATTPAAVPQGCYCVFVNPKFLSTWTAFNSKGVGRLTIDRDYFLTFVLLHEAGHIQAGTAAAAFKNGEISQLNVDPSKEKADERRADEFAAELLRQRAYATPASSSSIAANFVVNELVKLGWNMQAFRTLDEFASFSTGKPSVYFDDGYTHPNMALRILRTNNLIQRTAETQSLLDAFEQARQRGANPKPLYQQR